MRHGHGQGLTRGWVRSLSNTHQIHRQIRHMNKGQTLLGSQPTQEDDRPALVTVASQPDLLPVALIFPGDLDGLTQGIIEVIDQFPKPFLRKHLCPRELGKDLSMGHEIGVTADR